MSKLCLFNNNQINRVNSKVFLATITFTAFLTITLLILSNIIQDFDANLFLKINRINLGEFLTEVIKAFTNYGREHFWIPIVALMLMFGKRNTKLLAIELATLFLLGIIIGESTKLFVARERPFEVLSSVITRFDNVDTSSSYPSGHALIVVIGAFFSLVKFKIKKIAIFLSAIAGFVCFSRIYVGSHYPLDILAGILLAISIVGFGLFALDRYFDKTFNKIIKVLTRVLNCRFFNLVDV